MELNKKSQLEDKEPQPKRDAGKPTQFNSLPNLTQKRLYELADSVIGVVPHEQRSWIIRISNLQVESKVFEIVHDVRQWATGGSKFLYYLEVIGQADLTSIRKTYSDARDRDKGKRAYARLLKSHSSSSSVNKNWSTCFYVGSSSNISLRLKEHIGYGAKETFSLQLAHWTNGLDLNLSFVCAKYFDSAKPEVYQALEDTLWDLMQPIFGRKGGR